MAKVLVNETSLTGIANAIRGKNGTEGTYKPSEMAAAIEAIVVGGGGGDLPEEALVLSGNCQYRFAYNSWNWFIEQHGDKITTKDITVIANMFNSSTTLKNIPFVINIADLSSGVSASNIFVGCPKLEQVPEIKNLRPNSIDYIFEGCFNLREIPEDFSNTWDWTDIDTAKSQYSASRCRTFNNCYSLRSFPMEFLSHGNPVANYSYSIYNYGFTQCYNLDEIVNLPIPHLSAVWTSNTFISFVNRCNRLKNMTFALQENGIPYAVSWKSQTIDLSTYVGYGNTITYITSHNSGITADKEVTDDATYQELKNDPDWFTCNVAYSRYNHDSAVATINSLPDTSAYLATAGGTNTIKFKGEAGSATDGGAINTLTEEEIAVATAKGWTVTLT